MGRLLASAAVLAVLLSGSHAAAQERDVDLLVEQCISAPDGGQMAKVENACNILIEEGILADLLEYGDINAQSEMAAYANRGLARVMLGRDEAALVDARAVRARDPDHAMSYWIEGVALFHLDRRDEALVALSTYLRKTPTDVEALWRRGALHRVAGRTDLAQRDQEAALRQSPNDGNARAERARLRYAAEDWGGAITDLDVVIGALPDADAMLSLRSSAHLERRDFDLAIADADRAATLQPDNAQYHNQRCWARAVANQDLSTALAACDLALSLQPRAAGILDSRGLVRLRQGDDDGAHTDYDAAVRAEPDFAGALFGRGLASLRMGARELGQPDIDAALAIDPDIGREYERMGLPWPAAGDRSVSLDQCLRPAQTTPEVVVVGDCNRLFEQGRLTTWDEQKNGRIRRGLARAEIDDFAGALIDADEAASVGAEDDANLIRARVALRQDRTGDGLTLLNAYLANRPNDARALTWRAVIAFGQQRRADGRADLDAAVRADPAFLNARSWRARERATLRNWSGVVEDMDAALTINPGEPTFYTRRSSAHLELSNHAEAIRDADSAWDAGDRSWNAANQRCWARAVADRDLQTARAACDASIRMNSHYANLDSRGLVGLRQGRNQDAWNDYNAAVTARPDQASPLYGRGIAAIRLGRAAEGYADLAAAVQKEATVADDFSGMGVRP